MNAEDMTPDDASPRRRPPLRKYLYSALTANVGLNNRVAVVAALCAVSWSAEDGLWWTLAAIAFWGAFLQVVLFDVQMTGWVIGHAAGHEHADEARGQGTVQVSTLLELCERYGVPPQEIEQMIWGDKP